MPASSLLVDDVAFRALVERAESSSEIALDCEFHGEKRYRPTLYLVQINLGGEAVAVDASRVDLRPLASVLSNPGVRKLFHAGREDIRLLAKATGAAEISGILDTQIAAAFLGHGLTIGYARLVKSLLDVELDKGSQFTDWSRELTDEQVDYALNDVRYLPPVANHLVAELERRGRLGWVLDAARAMGEAALTEPDPRKLYRKISGFASLNPVQLGVLRELAIWRDRIAASENCRPEGIASDPGLKQLALRPPSKVAQLRGMRGLGIGASERYWPGLRDALARGAAEPEPVPAISDADLRVESVVALLGAVRRVISLEHDVAPELLASSAELRTLAEWQLAGRSGAPPEVDALAGWRKELVGGTLLETLSGNVSIRVATAAPSGLELTSSGVLRRPSRA